MILLRRMYRLQVNGQGMLRIGKLYGEDITWGHAISKRFDQWDELPLPLNLVNVVACWRHFHWLCHSPPDGRLIMLFTGADKYGEQLQNLAYPADPSDDLLIKWTKYPGNPILRHPPGVGPTDYRDPTTAWLTSEGKWRISIGSKYNRTQEFTTDFINCKLKDTLLHSVEGVGMWECVDFFPVSTTSDDGLDVSYNGTNIKHVMKASMDDDRYDTCTGGLVLSVYQFFLQQLTLLDLLHSDGSLTTHFCSDQSRSSLAYDVIKDVFGSTVPVLQGEKLTMRILVDHSIIESFAQRGRTNIISRVYPTQAIYNNARLFLFNNATINASIQVWQMESAQLL
ncbi:hypothetical protein Leryth_016659 [Lithospermum erythrorhizon]|nr:hypothetical protein Leryth_016659 [Lithospermum erythrorhizon]